MIPGTWRSLIQYNHFSILFLIKLSKSVIYKDMKPQYILLKQQYRLLCISNITSFRITMTTGCLKIRNGFNLVKELNLKKYILKRLIIFG